MLATDLYDELYSKTFIMTEAKQQKEYCGFSNTDIICSMLFITTDSNWISVYINKWETCLQETNSKSSMHTHLKHDIFNYNSVMDVQFSITATLKYYMLAWDRIIVPPLKSELCQCNFPSGREVCLNAFKVHL